MANTAAVAKAKKFKAKLKVGGMSFISQHFVGPADVLPKVGKAFMKGSRMQLSEFAVGLRQAPNLDLEVVATSVSVLIHRVSFVWGFHF